MRFPAFARVYVLLLIFHFAHVFEELLGKAAFIDTMYGGTSTFLTIGALLFAIPVTLFYFTMKGKHWAYNLSYTYGGIMIIDGFFHLADRFLTGNYFGGTAGVYTGSGLIIFGIALIYALWKEPTRR